MAGYGTVLVDDNLPSADISGMGLDAYPTSAWRNAGAEFSYQMDTGVTARGVRGIQRETERIGPVSGVGAEFGEDALKAVGQSREEAGFSRMLTPEDANKLYGIPGHIKFDEDIPEYSAQQIQATKQRELLRKSIEKRTADGFGKSLLEFGAGVVGSMFDPLNIASAFIPVVGEARYLAMVEGLGSKTAARLVRGGIEGTVGTALTEPANAWLANAEQADYKMADALLNVTFGGILGGGLHAGLGKLGDLMRGEGLSEPALRDALAALAEDRAVQVHAPIKAALYQSVAHPSVIAPAGPFPGVDLGRLTVGAQTLDVALPRSAPRAPGQLGRDLREVWDDLLPPELKKGQSFTSRTEAARGAAEAASWERVAAIEDAHVDVMKAQATLDLVEGRIGAGNALRAEVMAAEEKRLKGVIASHSADRKATSRALSDARQARQAAQAEVVRLEAKASPLEGVGIIPAADRQLAELGDQMTAARKALDDATYIERRAKQADKDAKLRREETKQQLENAKVNALSQVPDMTAPLSRAKERKGNVEKALRDAEFDLRAAQAHYDLSIRLAKEDARRAVQQTVSDIFKDNPHAFDAAAHKAVTDAAEKAKPKGTDIKASDKAGLQEDVASLEKTISDSGVPHQRAYDTAIAEDTEIKRLTAMAKAADAVASCQYLRG